MSTKTKTKRKIKTSRGDRVFYTISYIIIGILGLIVLYPMVYVVAASMSSADALMSGKVWLWPVDISFEGYKAVFKSSDVWLGYANTIFYTVVGTIINVAITLLCAYPLSRKELFGRNVITFIFSFTMLFGGGLIPNYLLIKGLGILNTRWALLLPGAMSIYNMIVCRTFIQTSIPTELLESARLDGCDDIRYFFKIVLPLSKAIIAVLTLWYAVGHWNAYFNAFIYLNDRQLYPLQIFLRDILISNKMSADLNDPELANQLRTVQMTLKYALIVVSTAPMFMFYPFTQKYFQKGVMVGSIKG